MAKAEFEDVKWRNYPNRIENQEFLLVRKGWSFRLLYDVYEKKRGILLGTCIVKERADKCNCPGKGPRFRAEELVSKSTDFKPQKLDKIFNDVLLC